MLKANDILFDRRQEPRYKIPLALHLFLTSGTGTEEPHKTSLRNVSQDGLSFALPILLKPRKQYNLELQLGADMRFHAQLKMMWTKQVKSNSYMYGGCLTYFSGAQMGLLGEFLERVRKACAAYSERRSAERRKIRAQLIGKEKRGMDRRFAKRFLDMKAKLSDDQKYLNALTMPRVVITGLGIISPNGVGKEMFFKALKTNKSGISMISRFDTRLFSTHYAGEVNDTVFFAYLEKCFETQTNGDDSTRVNLTKKRDRPVQFAIGAAIEALVDSGIDLTKINRSTVGISMGTIMGGLGFALAELGKYYRDGLRHVSPYTVAAVSPNPCSGEIAAQLRLRGPSTTFSSGCTSGLNAVSYACEQIRRGNAAVMLAGGTDSPLQEPLFAAFCRSGMLAASSNGLAPIPKPMDKDRAGIVLGEGAAVLVLEDLEHALARNARIYAEISGDANTCDGYDMVKWRWHGTEAARAIKTVLETSNLSQTDISVIFVHATGSKEGDGMELRALTKALGDYAPKIPISNVKGLIGYCQGACAVIELAAACLALERGIIPAIPSFEEADKPLNISRTVRQQKLQNALVNCFGFGGKNTCVLIKKLEVA